jgi:protease I
VPKKILEENGLTVVTASTVPGALRGKKDLVTAQVDITLDKVQMADYAGIMIVGGQATYWYDTQVLQLVREFYQAGKLVAAICISGVIPAQAGIMRGKEYTMFVSPESLADAKKHEGTYVARPVVVSDNVITADGPDSAGEFGRAIVKFLQK